MATSCSSLTCLLIGGRRRLIRHSLRIAISGSKCNLASHYPRRSFACCTSNMTTVLINFSRSHDRFLIHKIVTWQILCTLRDVTSFLDVFPSDLLPSSRLVLKPCTLINADPHTEGGSH